MEELKEFMKDRPHDKDVPLVDAVMWYIIQVENNTLRLSEELEECDEARTYV